MGDSDVMPSELDIVVLRVPKGRWPAGTEGTLVEAFEAGGLVEIEDGSPRDHIELISVKYSEVAVVDHADPHVLTA